MTAAKWGDVVLGIDIHQVMVPTPGGPVPTPMPHAFFGVVFDPLGAAISAAISAAVGGGGAVLINGMPAGNTGTEVSGLGHTPTPPGTAFSRDDIPADRGTLVTGSKTVIFGGTSQSRTGSTVMSCSYPISLPTSVCLPIPMGAPVLIGGPESVDAAAAVTRGIRTKWVSKQLHAATGATKGSFRSKLICALTGHPVDVMSGELIADAVDFELPGMIPIRWERNYRSRQTHEGALGPGWCHPLEESIEETPERLVLRLADGRPKEHAALKPGASDWDGEDRCTLTRTKAGYEKRGADGLRWTFERVPGTSRFVPTRIEDRCGNAIAIGYERGMLSAICDTAGRTLRARWNDQGRLTGIDVEGEALVRYEYDAEGRLAAAIDPLGHALRYEYRGGVMVKETHKGGLSFHFAWDWEHPEGWCVRTWGDGGIYDRRISYDKHRHFTAVEDGRGGITQYWGNALGFVERMRDPMGVVTVTTWDEHCRKTSETDGLGARTEWAYDARGNCVLQRDALGNETRVEYNEEDDPVRLTDAAGAVWRLEYDGHGNPRRARDPLGAVTSYAFDAAGRLCEIEDPAGRRMRANWTPRHDLESVSDGEGRTTRFEHDALGRLVQVRDAAGLVERMTRDALGRVTLLERANGERLAMRHDAEGNVIEQVDALGRRVRMRYAGMNRLVEQIDPMGFRVRLEHDLEEELVAVENQVGERWRIERDRAGRVVAEIGFDGGKHRYLYDEAGRPSRVLGPDYRVAELERDVIGRLSRRKLSAPLAGVRAGEEAFAFDARGDLIEARTGEASVRIERDARGGVLRERCAVGGREHFVESRYDAGGERVERRTDLGHRLEYFWDGAGDLCGMRAGSVDGLDAAWEMTIARDALGLEAARRMPGGVVASWARDTAGRPVGRRVRAGMLSPGAGRDVLRMGYAWAGPERIGAMIDAQRGTTRLRFDARGHLIGAELPDGRVQHRESDAVANVYRAADRSDRSYGAGGRVLRVGGTEYHHDGCGNLVEKRLADGGKWKYRWDPAGRLREVERPDGKRVRYAYDALGRRVSKEFEGAVTEYVWDGDELVHEVVHVPEGEVGSAVTWIFEPGTFAPAAKLEGKQRYGVVSDCLGAPMALMTEAGEIAWRAQLDLYGVPREEGERHTTACAWRYPGQYEDAEPGLYYNRFRYYDPELGRYISQDPIGLLGGLSRYAYTHDPSLWIDPLGLVKNYVSLGEAGRFADLDARAALGDDLTPHHVPQQGLGFLPRRDGGAIVMHKVDHEQTRTFGAKGRFTKVQDAALSFREAVAKDIVDLRRKFGTKYDQGIRGLLEYYRRRHPNLIAMPKRGCK